MITLRKFRPVIPISINSLHESKGKPSVKLEKVPLDNNIAVHIADAYDALRHDPTDPDVRLAYDAFILDIKEQWTYAQRALGIRLTLYDEQPYGSAEEMFGDVTMNRHIGVWHGEGDMPPDHPLHHVDPDSVLTYNTIFRAVHDIFGHTAGRNGFTEEGEENAYFLHRQSYSRAAIPALATETRGQACWFFNNRDIRDGRVAIGTFAPQKAGILPEKFYDLLHPKEQCATPKHCR